MLVLRSLFITFIKLGRVPKNRGAQTWYTVLNFNFNQPLLYKEYLQFEKQDNIWKILIVRLTLVFIEESEKCSTWKYLFCVFSFSARSYAPVHYFSLFYSSEMLSFQFLRFWCHWIMVIKWNRKYIHYKPIHQHIGVS